MAKGWPRARALIGGLDAWKDAGLGVEPKSSRLDRSLS
jgi:3-mercaptopyruvate sulfurtransferase SseA